ncbi:MAG: hypothetical protein BGO01_18530 [Armatimonadetes bacterium 55-13]|nr:MAG: hypothetical protein BGO01_18530 [Armatimonadetes bacterium 55-13]
MLAFLGAVALLQVQTDARLAKAFRKDQAGWIYTHLEGKPKDIGFQYGYLLAAEIDDAHRALKGTGLGSKTWAWYRIETKKLFWEKLDPEYQQELTGMAEGMVAKGYKYDVWDMLAFNAHIEVGGYYVPWLESQRTGKVVTGAKEACSAFVAVGKTTKDGKVVMGHNLWWDYIMGQRFNAVLDIKPEKGNRVMMDALCGFIHSGSDFAINSAGLMLCETTISGFHGFDPEGLPEFMRMRKAIQYGNSLDDMVRIFKKGNNGGYANTWLMADTRSNEIGKLQLGLKNVVFDRTKDGFYVGSNFPEDPKIIKDEVIGFNPDPNANGCIRRKVRWNSLLTQNQGKVDAVLAQSFLGDTYDEVLGRKGASGSTLCGRADGFGGLSGAVNSLVGTSDSVGKMSLWARMGFSDGSTLDPGEFFKKFPQQKWAQPYLRSIPTQPWIRMKAL